MRYSERVFLIAAVICVVVAGTVAVITRDRTPVTDAGETSTPGALSDQVMSVESGAFSRGHWYLADAKSHVVHVLDSLGQRHTAVGRRGRGPGEFIGPVQVAASTSRLYVAELGRREISVFDIDGSFLAHLRPARTCAGSVQAIAGNDSTVYVLRRCLEPPRRVLFQLERSVNGGPIEPWLLTDTVPIVGEMIPLNFRSLSVRGDRLVFANGDTGCLRAFHLPEARFLGEHCLLSIKRVVVPAEKRVRGGGRVTYGDSLPRFVNLVLFDSTLAVESVQDFESTTWLEFDWRSQGLPGRPLGRPRTRTSFLNSESQLITHRDVQGLRFEVVRVQH